MVKCARQGKVDGKRCRGTPKTSYNSNIAKGMGENIDQITRDSRKRARSRKNVRGVACLIPCLSPMIINPDWTAKEEVNVLSDEFTRCVYLSVDVEQSHNEWIRNLPGDQEDHIDDHNGSNQRHQMSVFDGLQQDDKQRM